MKITAWMPRPGLLRLSPTPTWCKAQGYTLLPSGEPPRQAQVDLEGDDLLRFLEGREDAIRVDLEKGWILSLWLTQRAATTYFGGLTCRT